MKLFPFLVIATVFIAGCTAPGTAPSTATGVSVDAYIGVAQGIVASCTADELHLGIEAAIIGTTDATSPTEIADGVLERCADEYAILEDILMESGNSAEVAAGVIAIAKSDSREQIISMLSPS